MSTVQVRMDPKLKKDVQKILDELGFDMSTAIKAYFHQIINRKGIPFPLLTENGLTFEQEEGILEAAEEMKHGKNIEGPFESADDLIKELNA